MTTVHYLAALGVGYAALVLAACLTIAIIGERERHRRVRAIARRPVAPLVPLDLHRSRRERAARDQTRGVA